jgi:exodeoxyribonuclease VII large subunit
VISAVGHEVDVTVADYVADARASTPTKAGVVAVPDQIEVVDKLDHWQQRLKQTMTGCFALRQTQLHALTQVEFFKRPAALLQNKQQQVDEITQRLYTRMTDRIHWRLRQLSQYYEQVGRLEPHRLLGKQVQRLDRLCASMQSVVKERMHSRTMQLENIAHRLAGLNPRSVLNRGYSMTLQVKNGRLVRRAQDVQVGDRLITELAEDQRIESQVTSIPKAQVPKAQVPKAPTSPVNKG